MNDNKKGANGMSKVLTFKEFQASGKDCFLDEKFPNAGLEGAVGRVYADGRCYIERIGGKWMLVIANADFESDELSVLERRLYTDWYLPEKTEAELLEDRQFEIDVYTR